MSQEPIHFPFALDERLWFFGGKIAHIPVTSSEDFSTALDEGMLSLTASEDPGDQWSYFFSPSDIVGIKVNCRLGPGRSTSAHLVAAIAEKLTAIGVPSDRIIAWDRRNADLSECGFQLSTRSGAMRCFGVEDVFEEEIEEAGEIAGRFSLINSRLCTAMISVPFLRQHPIEGIDGCVHNLFDGLENAHKLNASVSATIAAEFLSMRPVREKWRLGIMECEGLLMLSADPVALDSAGLAQLNRRPEMQGKPQLECSWLETAQDLGLGLIQ